MRSTIYDSIRDAYDLVFSDTYKKVPFVIDVLKRHGIQSVLELGSGSGLFSIPIEHAGFDIEGLDISQEMISFMRRKHADLTIHHGDIRNYRLNKKFDAILILSSTLVLLGSHEAIGESLRCSYNHLPNKGILFLELPNHPVEIRKSNHTQEVYVGDDGDMIVVIQSHATERSWRENWYIFRQDGGVFSQETTICDELLYSPEILESQLHHIGFEIIETHGDLFGSPFDENSSWRRVWICQKAVTDTAIIDTPDLSPSLSEALQYYNHELADKFYKHVWADDDIFIGLGWHDDGSEPDSIAAACQRMVDNMVALIPNRRHTNARLLDLGSGYGAPARHLARKYGFHVDCLNLSESQNAENGRLNQKYDLHDKIDVFRGNFESLEFPNKTYPVVWSQDAFLHSGNRTRVLREIDRVLQQGGDIVFTDILQAQDCPHHALGHVLDRFGLENLATQSFYHDEAEKLDWRIHVMQDISSHLVEHYRRVIRELEFKYDQLLQIFGEDYLNRMRQGMENWIKAGEQGYLQWGMFHFGKT